MINIPQNGQWQQTNNSDLFGNVFATKNITFDSDGYLRLSNSVRSIMDDTKDAQFDMPLVMVRSDDYGYFALTIDQPFQISASAPLTYLPQEIGGIGSPDGSLMSDAKYFDKFLAATESNGLNYYNDSTDTWTATDVVLTATAQSQHPIAVMPNQSALAVANVYEVKLYDSPLTATPTLLRTLTILQDFYITSMCYFNQNLYIGTMHRYGGRALLYVWNGNGTAAQAAYEIDSNMIFDVCVHKDSVWVLSGSGAVLRYNGGGFNQMAAFPIYFTDRFLSDETNIPMFKNVMKSNGDLLYFNFTDSENYTVILNQPAGVWCFDERVGLYHRYSPSISIGTIDTVLTTAVDTSTDTITVAAAPTTGTEVLYNRNGSTAIAGLVSGNRYYAIKTGSTTMKLASTRALADAGTAIDLTGTGNNTQQILCFPDADYGQFMVDRNGALCILEKNMTDVSFGTDVLFGTDGYGRTNAALATISATTPALSTRGYFVTPKIFSKNVTDVYDLVTLRWSPFKGDNDKIIIKYRTTDDGRDELKMSNSATAQWYATWTSSTTFTTTEVQMADAEVGNEVEFLRGAAAGLIAHITNISETGGTYTVTIDETFENYTSGDKSNFVFRNWIKWDTISATDADASLGYFSKQLGATGKFIQLKLELRGVQVRIEDLAIDDKYQLPSRK
jgi:hypothetical protein